MPDNPLEGGGPHEDLSREIERLWAKVSASAAAPGPESFGPLTLAEGGPSRDAAWETVALLKSQHRRQARAWSEVLEAKEKTLAQYRQGQELLERELQELRAKVASFEGRSLEEKLELQARLEAAAESFEQERRRFEEEGKSLKAILDQTRRRLAAEAARFREEQEQWRQREQQYLIDLKELQTLAERRREESGRAGTQASLASDSLQEAKKTIEKTLAELLSERRVREESEKERSEALKKVDQLGRHFEELSKIWDEERAHWRELWQRERSTWDSQRVEFFAWEGKLRQERQEWLAEISAKEKEQLGFAEKLARTLRESSETSSMLHTVMRTIASAQGRRAAVLLWPSLEKWRRGGAWVTAFLLAGAALIVWRHLGRPRVEILARHNVVLGAPAALAFDGQMLWVFQQDGQMLAFEPQDASKVARSARWSQAAPSRLSAAAFGRDSLWTLDGAKNRLLRHAAGEPGKALAWRESPGPSPALLAWDGVSLWSYDALNRSLYRHGRDEGDFKSYPFPAGGAPSSMAWVSGRLWVFDSRKRELIRLDFKEEAFRVRSRSAFGEEVAGMAALSSTREGPRRLWMLTGPSRDKPVSSLIECGY